MRAAIAHDIRSPLAVLRGYQEMMLEFIPEDRFDKVALMEMLQDGMNQIDSMNRFLESMRKLSSLEEREIHRKKSSFDSLKNRIAMNIITLEKSSGKKAEMKFHISKQLVDISDGRDTLYFVLYCHPKDSKIVRKRVQNVYLIP